MLFRRNNISFIDRVTGTFPIGLLSRIVCEVISFKYFTT